MCITKLKTLKFKNIKKMSFYKGLFESFSFYFRKHEVMTLFSKNPITFEREQVI